MKDLQPTKYKNERAVPDYSLEPIGNRSGNRRMTNENKLMARHNIFGKNGERLAKEYLEKSGYEILDENWTFGKAEVDLIVYKERQIIFVEVKTRSGNAFGEPEDFVDPAKQLLLENAANEYIYLMGHKGEIRFDIVSILFDKHGAHAVNHIPDAFWPC